MPTNYTGSAGSLAITDPVTISDPNDGELASVASILTPVKKLADWIDLIRTLPLLGAANPTSSYQLIASWGSSSGSQGVARLYFDAFKGFAFTQNALWVPGTPGWQRDNAGSHSFKYSLTNGVVQIAQQTSATWADTAWLAGDSASLEGGFRGRNTARVVGTVLTGASPSVVQGYWVGTPSYPATDTMRIPFSLGLGTNAYTVIVNPLGAYVPQVVTKNASYFDIKLRIAAAASSPFYVDPVSATSLEIDFQLTIPQ